MAASLGQPERFHAVVDRHVDAIAAFLSRRVGPDAAQDLAQETFIAAFRARARFDARFASARPWLLGIATRAVASHRREERRQLELYRRAAAATPPLGPADPGGAPLDPALFAGLPGIRLVGDVEDPLGRPGTAVAADGDTDTENVGVELILDRATGLPLAIVHYRDGDIGKPWLYTTRQEGVVKGTDALPG